MSNHRKRAQVDLLYHLEALSVERDKRYEQRFQQQQEALRAAFAANEKRFDNTNEWRQTYGDLAQRGVGGWASLAAVATIGVVVGGLLIQLLKV